MIYHDVIDEFKGEYRWLSNFWIHDEALGLSVEHYYQAAKATNLDDILRIMDAGSPYKAKQIAKEITLRPDWESVKLGIMTTYVRDKFTLFPDMRYALMATEGMFLIEGNTWGDTYWGVCNGVGQNHLGRIIMDVRDKIILGK